MPRYRIILRNGASRSLVGWLRILLPVLRQAPPDVRVTVEIERLADRAPPDDPPN